MRTLIIGGPKTGKTTLAEQVAAGRPVRHTDDLITDHAWSEASAVATDGTEPVVIEGVAVVRALRKWLARHPEGSLDDVEIVHLTDEHGEVSPKQHATGKGHDTIWSGIVLEATARGAKVRRA